MTMNTHIMLLIGERIKCDKALTEYMEYLRREDIYTCVIYSLIKINPKSIYYAIEKNYLDLFKMFAEDESILKNAIEWTKYNPDLYTRYLDILRDPQYEKIFTMAIDRGVCDVLPMIDGNYRELFDITFSFLKTGRTLSMWCSTSSVHALKVFKFLAQSKRYHSVIWDIAKPNLNIWRKRYKKEHYLELVEILNNI